jgi:alkanesulfonate monooxygenase SsuD/methylene tetrahydromethanopterin reductase-like flavin-dependent oxidoreductase (luciferase family)
LRRVVEFGNGWFPRWQRKFEPDDAVARLHQAAAAAGRDPTTFSITVFNANWSALHTGRLSRNSPARRWADGN